MIMTSSQKTCFLRNNFQSPLEDPLNDLNPQQLKSEKWSSILLVLVVYMSSNFGLLTLESRDLSQAEKEKTACKPKQIKKMSTLFTQNGPIGCRFE